MHWDSFLIFFPSKTLCPITLFHWLLWLLGTIQAGFSLDESKLLLYKWGYSHPFLLTFSCATQDDFKGDVSHETSH